MKMVRITHEILSISIIALNFFIINIQCISLINPNKIFVINHIFTRTKYLIILYDYIMLSRIKMVKKSLTIKIIVPSTGFENVVSLPVTLEGFAQDDKEKDISDQIIWKSNRDGKLGTGKRITKILTAGTHQITANIEDDNQTVTTKISITITEEKEPPITVTSLTELCWGLSLSLSHDTNQKLFGDNFREKILQIFASYQVVKKEETDVSYHPSVNTKKFIDNIMLVMTKTVRNIGFARDSHTNFLKGKSKEFENKKIYYNDLSSLASFKTEGLAPKVISFFSGGTLISAITEINKFPSKIDSQTQESISKTIREEIAENATADKIIEEISNLNEAAFSISAIDVVMFAIFGLIGLAVFNVGAKIVVHWVLKETRKNIGEELSESYILNYRENLVTYLVNFYDDILKLAKKFYKNDYKESLDLSHIVIDKVEYNKLYEEKSRSELWKSLGKKNYELDNSKLGEEQKVEMFVRYKILPVSFISNHPENLLAG